MPAVRSTAPPGSGWGDITAWVQAEEAYHTLVENSLQGLVLFQEGRFAFVNPAMVDIVGYSRDELLAFTPETIHQILHPDDHEQVMGYTRARQMGQSVPSSYEIRLIRKDGTIRRVEVAVSLTTYRGRAATQVAYIDITERKQAEEALRASEARFVAFMQYLPGPAFIHDQAGHVLFANQVYCRHLGVPTDVVIGQPFSSFLPPQLAAYFQAQDRQVLARQEVCVFEDRAEIDGRTTVFMTTKFPIQQINGQSAIGGVSIDITERKQAEEALRASERFVQQIADTMPDILYIFDLTLQRNVYSNRQIGESLGYTSEEVQAMGDAVLPTLLHPDDLPHVLQHQTMQIGAPDGVILPIEYRMRHRDGSWRWLLSREVVFSRTNAGNPCQILGVAQDITERKLAEEAYRILVENSLQGLTIHQQGHCVFANAAAAQITGYTVDELLALSPAEAAATIHPDDRDMVMQRARERQAGATVPQHYTFRILHKGGSVRWLEAFAIRVIYQGRPGAQMAYIDITERKLTEDALRASEARYRTLVEHFPDGVVFLFDHDLRYLVAGGQQLASVGIRPDMLEGKTLWEATPPNIAAIGEPLYRATLAGTAPKEVEQHYGDQIYRTQPVSLRDEQGKIVAGMIISQDITERKQAELQLQRANAQLHQANAWLRERNREVLLLNQMGDLLQSCPGVAEAYAVIAGSAEKLFAGQAGALYLRRAGSRLFDSVAAWGTPAPATAILDQPDCQALQQPVCNLTTAGGAICRDIKDGDGAMMLCVPLLVRGETLGMLQLRHTKPPDAEVCRRRQQLADIVARQISLALTNLTLREQLQQQAIRDALTGLYNRRYLDATLPRELQRAERYEHPIAVVMLDIDHFKRFNDTYGHDAGDTLLREVGSFLQAHTRGEDLACRYGGEEFTLVLPGASLEATLLRTETIRAAIQRLAVEHQGQPLARVTASLGVAVFPQHGTSADMLIRAADQALYQAKRTGRDRVVVAEETISPDGTMEKSP